jgi:hypothetical protein
MPTEGWWVTYFTSILIHGSVRIGKHDSGVVGDTEQSYRSGNERPKELDEYSLECTQEFMGMASWGCQ